MSNEKVVLIVDDNPDDIALTLRALKRNGLACQIEVVRTGEEALDWLYAKGEYAGRNINQKPFLILLDMHMPGISGLDVLKKIRSKGETKYLPVVLFSTSQNPEDIAKSYDLGANSYVRKPVDFTGYSESMHQLGYYWYHLNEQVDVSA